MNLAGALVSRDSQARVDRTRARSINRDSGHRRKFFTGWGGASCHRRDGRMSRCYKQSISTVSGTENHMDHRRLKRYIQRKASVQLAMIFRVPLSMLRAGQTKREHFVVCGSLDFPVTGSPIESAI